MFFMRPTKYDTYMYSSGDPSHRHKSCVGINTSITFFVTAVGWVSPASQVLLAHARCWVTASPPCTSSVVALGAPRAAIPPGALPHLCIQNLNPCGVYRWGNECVIIPHAKWHERLSFLLGFYFFRIYSLVCTYVHVTCTIILLLYRCQVDLWGDWRRRWTRCWPRFL